MGATLYVLITSVIPFEPGNKDDYDIYFKGEPIIDQESDEDDDDEEDLLLRFKYISGDCKDLIRKMLCADPEKRPSIDEALKHPWFNILNDDDQDNVRYQENKEILDVIDNPKKIDNPSTTG